MDLVSYRPLGWLLLIVLLAWGFSASLVQRPRGRKWASFGLRVAGVALLALAMCRPFMTRSRAQAHLVFLLDVSASVDLPAARGAVDDIRAQIGALGGRDSWSMLLLADGARLTTPDEAADLLEGWQQGLADDDFRGASDLARGLEAARLTFPAGKARRVVLYSDGRDTSGQLDDALGLLAAEQTNLRVVDLPGLDVPEVAVLGVTPDTPLAHHGQRVRLHVEVSSNRAMPATLRILNRGVVQAQLPVELAARPDNRFGVALTMTVPGSSVWEAEIVAPEDHFAVNNRAACTIDVTGRPRVLVVHEKPPLMRAFRQALEPQGFDVDVRGLQGLPGDLPEMLAFDAIILADCPASALTDRQMLLVRSYVSDFGGGLLMLGSENSFGLGGYFRTPIEQVLPLVSRYEKQQERASLAMMLVIDKSGSMEGLPIALARQAARASVEVLGPRDQVAVLAFDQEPYLVCPMTPTTESDRIFAAIDSLSAGGGTNLFPAMLQGRDLLLQAGAQVRHMIILSDGLSEPGNFLELAAEMADAGLTVSTVALGPGADQAMMQAIAEIGRGRYYQTMQPETVPRIFAQETFEASRSAIREEPFLPIVARHDDLLDGVAIEDAPFLLGYVMVAARPTARTLLLTETGDPLLALGRFGLGTTAAFASDVGERWAGEWLHWPDFGRFWAQVLRTCIRHKDTGGVDVRAEVRPDRVVYHLTCTDRAGERLNGIEWDAMVLDSRGLVQAAPVRPVGLGRYQVELPRPAQGHFTLRLHDTTREVLRVLHHHEPPAAEYTLADRPPASFTGLPRLDPAAPTAGLPPATTRQPIQVHLLVLAILALAGSIYLRRL